MSAKTQLAATNDFAVIQTGGKQYPVTLGETLKVEKLGDDLTVGASVTFDQVLMTVKGDSVAVGTPTVKAKVTAEVVEIGKAEKIRVTRFMPKSNRHRTIGHRQPFTKIKITSIA